MYEIKILQSKSHLVSSRHDPKFECLEKSFVRDCIEFKFSFSKTSMKRNPMAPKILVALLISVSPEEFL